MANHAHDTETMSEHMDYAQHEGTYRLFITLGKWTIGTMALLMVAIYFLIKH